MTVGNWGTGREDYSQNVEVSTEPIVRSWESQYIYFVEIPSVAANSSTTVNATIDADTVVILYDFFLATTLNVLISLEVYAVGVDGSVGTIFRDREYQSIYHPIPVGFPFFNIIRYVYRNMSNEVIDLNLTMSGLSTAEKNYNLAILSAQQQVS